MFFLNSAGIFFPPCCLSRAAMLMMKNERRWWLEQSQNYESQNYEVSHIDMRMLFNTKNAHAKADYTSTQRCCWTYAMWHIKYFLLTCRRKLSFVPDKGLVVLYTFTGRRAMIRKLVKTIADKERKAVWLPGIAGWESSSSILSWTVLIYDSATFVIR